MLDPAGSPTQLPAPESALESPNGLLAAGGSLTPPWLLHAYRHGIFPWFSDGEPILWWSPDPRAVFDPRTFQPSRSLRQAQRNRGYQVLRDADFAATVRACAQRNGAEETWITPSMQAAYCELHRLGHAHSFETHLDGRFVGGLYGVRIGRVFCGESMVSFARDASKVALAALLDWCCAQGIELVDCQMPTPHLLSLGATPLGRSDFLQRLSVLTSA